MSAGAGARAAMPWYRFPWVWFVFAIPAVAVLMGVVMLVLAGRGFDGLVADDYYKRGMQVNRSLERDRLAATHRLEGVVSVDRGARAVLVRLTGEGGYPAPPRIVLSFHHATRGGVDVAIDLEAGAEEGVYTGAWRELESGMWNVSLATAEWRLVGRHQVLPGATGDGAWLVVTPAPH